MIRPRAATEDPGAVRRRRDGLHARRCSRRSRRRGGSHCSSASPASCMRAPDPAAVRGPNRQSGWARFARVCRFRLVDHFDESAVVTFDTSREPAWAPSTFRPMAFRIAKMHMLSIAIRWRACMLAAAEGDAGNRRRDKSNWPDARLSMGNTVAEWLGFTLATCTPQIALPGCESVDSMRDFTIATYSFFLGHCQFVAHFPSPKLERLLITSALSAARWSAPGTRLALLSGRINAARHGSSPVECQYSSPSSI